MATKKSLIYLFTESKIDHSKYDSFVMCILTHGKENDGMFFLIKKQHREMIAKPIDKSYCVDSALLQIHMNLVFALTPC